MLTPWLIRLPFHLDNAIDHGKTLRDYGEFAITRKHGRTRSRKESLCFGGDHYQEFLKGNRYDPALQRPGGESLRPYLKYNTVGWDMAVPDIFRALKIHQRN